MVELPTPCGIGARTWRSWRSLRARRRSERRLEPGETVALVYSTEPVAATRRRRVPRRRASTAALAPGHGPASRTPTRSSSSSCWPPISSRRPARCPTIPAAAVGHRRLPLVQRLGPRHDDQPARSDARHRPGRGGRLDPAHLRSLPRRRPAAQQLPGQRRRDPRLQHRRRHPLVRPGNPRLRGGNRRRRRSSPISCPRCARSSSTTSPEPATASASTRPTACCGPASPGCS